MQLLLFRMNHAAFQIVAAVPTVHPNNDYPGSEIINRIIAWVLALLVIAAAVNVIVQLFKLRNAGEGGNAMGPAVNMVVSLVVITLIVTKGTGFINDWTGLFS